MYNKYITEKFNVNASFGGNMRHNTVVSSGQSGSEIKIPGKYFLNNTNRDLLSASNSGEIQKRVNSIYGAASFGYDDKVYLDLTGRNDWSSALAKDNRSYFYGSVNLSLLMHNIVDLSSTPIDFLKLRGSVAEVGNDTDPQQIVNLFSVAGDGYLGVTQINRPNIKFSESLRPEEITTSEFGVEFKMFKNRLYGDFTYYDITTKDLIFDVPVDPGTGFSAFRENIGEINNKGFEVLIGGVPVENENFSWDTSLNFAKNENTLVSLIEGQENFRFSSSNGGIVDVRAQVGGGYGDIYTTMYKRDDSGNLLLTAEGRPQATAEREKAGNYQPDFTGGFSNSFRYKNFTLNALVDFRVGGEVFSFTDAAMDGAGVSERSLQYRETGVTLDGLREQADADPVPNDVNITAQDYWGAVSGIGEDYVFSQTNVRMREISLTYNFPSSLLDNTFLSSASISAIGRNLFFIYKEADNFDPESSYSTSNFGQGVLFYALPTTRSVGLSLNVNF
jgi:outer membrane receptor protein involved in Fe transport